MLFQVTVPADNRRGPLYIEKALAAIHQHNRDRQSLTFMFSTLNRQVGLFCRCPDELADAVVDAVQDEYPHATITPVGEDEFSIPLGDSTVSATLNLRPDLFPILRHPQFEDQLNGEFADPVARVLGAVRSSSCGERATIEIHVRPVSWWRCWWSGRAVDRLARRRFRANSVMSQVFAHLFTSRSLGVRLLAVVLGLFAGKSHEVPSNQHIDTSSGRQHDREDDVQAAADKLGSHVFESRIRLVVSGDIASSLRDKIVSLNGALGAFTQSRLATFHCSKVRRGIQRLARRGFLLSNEELATLWHPPTAAVQAERMSTSEFTELEPPVELPSGEEDGAIILGRVRYRSRNDVFGLKQEDRRRHLYVVGKTGMGKTTLLFNQIVADIAAGRGVGLIDPHGDLAESILAHIPRHRTNDVVLFDAGDSANPPSYNPLACANAEQRSHVASGIVSAFQKLYGDSWGPRLEHILRNTVLSVVGVPGTSLVSLLRMLNDPNYRDSILGQVDDPMTRMFWHQEYANWNDRYRSEAIGPIQNKVGQFLSSPVIRAIVGHPNGLLDVREVMDQGRILIVNLSKGRIGEDASALLGSLLVTGIQQAAMARADLPEDQRHDFHLYVDEFQNFATQSFGVILSEARKYRLALTLAHQFLDQVGDETLSAVFGNVGSMITFQVGSRDAESLAEQLSKTPGDVKPTDLTNVPRYTAYARLLINGQPGRPFTMQTLPPPPQPNDDRSDIVRRASQRRYARSAGQVAEAIETAFTAA